MQVARFSKFGVGSSNLELRTSNFENSGGRVSNTWITYPLDQDNTGKLVLIPDKLFRVKALKRKGETH